MSNAFGVTKDVTPVANTIVGLGKPPHDMRQVHLTHAAFDQN
jgi:hypothetical protein